MSGTQRCARAVRESLLVNREASRADRTHRDRADRHVEDASRSVPDDSPWRTDDDDLNRLLLIFRRDALIEGFMPSYSTAIEISIRSLAKQLTRVGRTLIDADREVLRNYTAFLMTTPALNKQTLRTGLTSAPHSFVAI